MLFCTYVHDGPVMSAAKKDPESGEVHYIPIWIPERSENILKNLPEKACSEQRIKNDVHDQGADLYFGTTSRLPSVYKGLYDLNIPIKKYEEKKLFCLEETGEGSGSFEEITKAVQGAPARAIRQRFDEVMEKRKYGVGAAGRGIVSAFADVIAFLQYLRPGSTRVWI